MTETVPTDERSDTPGPIVVGVDGSDPSIAALRWACGQATATGQRVVAVAIWQWPFSLGMSIPLPSDYDPAGDATRMLQDVVARLAAEFPGVAVTTLVVEGHPGVALVAAAEHAGLLVVGSQGHNEIAGLVLGSVSQYCATHATSSVLVHRHRAL